MFRCSAGAWGLRLSLGRGWICQSDGTWSVADSCYIGANSDANGLVYLHEGAVWTSQSYVHVDWYDLQVLQDYFGRTIAETETIPEPSALGLLAIGAVALLCVRRRGRARP